MSKSLPFWLFKIFLASGQKPLQQFFFFILLYLNLKAPQLSHLPLKLNPQTFSANSTFDDSGHIPPTHTPSDSFMIVNKILSNDVFYVISGVNPKKDYGPDGVPPIVLKNCDSMLTRCVVNLLSLYLHTFYSFWKYVCVQSVPKKGDRSNNSSYRPKSLLSCLSKAFETILNQEILRHLPASSILPDRQYDFRKSGCTGSLFVFLSNSWPSSFSSFGQTFVVALDMSKNFDRFWHKSLPPKLPSYLFYHSLCTFISCFLSERSILL